MKQLKLVLLTVLLVSIATSSWGAWWIFGKSKDEVSITYMYLNGLSFDELGEKTKVYKDTMENGEILIKGKATAGKNKIALVEVSTDGQATWKEAELSSNGAYTYRFVPDVGKIYNIAVKVSDTAGKTNNVSATLREVAVSPDNVRKLIQDALARLISAYQTENASAFMLNVSDKFAGDPVNLDRAIQRDFSLFDNISLSFTTNNITSTGGKLAVSISYNRSLYATRTGTSYRDRGITDFTFIIEGGQAKVGSMKNPLIFGLSDAANIATGTTVGDPNALVLAVDDSGTVGLVPLSTLTTGSGTPAAYAGTYSGRYITSGGTGTYAMAVDQSGNLCGIVNFPGFSDAFSGTVDGSGIATWNGEHNSGEATIHATFTLGGTVSGTATDSGVSGTVDGTRTTTSVNRTVCNKTPGYYHGHYNGTLQPGNVVVDMTIDYSGNITGTVSTPTTYAMRGRIDANGNVTGTADAAAPDGLNGIIITGNAIPDGDYTIELTGTGSVSGMVTTGTVINTN